MKSFTSSIKFSSKRCSSLCFEVKKKKERKKEKVSYRGISRTRNRLLRKFRWYRVSALTRYSVARDKYSIERRFTVNWVRNLQWCIVVLYRRERERERGRENKPRNAFPIRSRVLHFSSSTTFIGKRGVGTFVLPIVSLVLSRYLWSIDR